MGVLSVSSRVSRVFFCRRGTSVVAEIASVLSRVVSLLALREVVADERL